MNRRGSKTDQLLNANSPMLVEYSVNIVWKIGYVIFVNLKKLDISQYVAL